MTEVISAYEADTSHLFAKGFMYAAPEEVEDTYYATTYYALPVDGDRETEYGEEAGGDADGEKEEKELGERKREKSSHYTEDTDIRLSLGVNEREEWHPRGQNEGGAGQGGYLSDEGLRNYMETRGAGARDGNREKDKEKGGDTYAPSPRDALKESAHHKEDLRYILLFIGLFLFNFVFLSFLCMIGSR